jgi:hypothetical protein
MEEAVSGAQGKVCGVLAAIQKSQCPRLISSGNTGGQNKKNDANARLL